MRPLSVGSNPAAATLTTVYTTPTGYYSLVKLLYIHNTGGSTKNITVQWYDASTNTSLDILTAYAFTTKEYIQFNGNAYIVFEEGDQLRVTTEAGSTFTVLATFEEIGLTRQ
jgi:hypothetical protein